MNAVLHSRIAIDDEELTDFCLRNHIRRLALFGSVLRDDYGPDSDIDVLVEFEPNHRVGYGFITLQDELAEGNKVATRWIMRGTQGARKLDVTGMEIFLIENGKIREIWVNMDSLAQAQQMGAVPAK